MLKQVLRRYQTEGCKGVVNAAWCRFFGPRIHPVEAAIDLLANQDRFTIVQLGSFVGNSHNDPIYKKLHSTIGQNKRIILVEPVKQYYDLLVKNYSHLDGVEFANVAISDRSGKSTLYRLGVDPVDFGYPDWLAQLSSLKESRMTELWDRYEADKELKDFYLRNRVTEEVTCITLSELVERFRIDEIDLLQIDVEGYELEILKTLDLNELTIRFINYERVLLQDKKGEADTIMRRWGYRLVDFDLDTFCFKPEDKHQLAKRWH
jgi:FkbM family methyltransferase